MEIEDLILSSSMAYNVGHLMSAALTKRFDEKDIDFIVKTIESGFVKPCYGKICGYHLDEYCVAALKCFGKDELYEKYIAVLSDVKKELVGEILDSQWGVSEESSLGKSVIDVIEDLDREKELNLNLHKYRKARCIKCGEGIVTPVFPHHKNPFDFACDKCDFRIHYDPAVTVE